MNEKTQRTIQLLREVRERISHEKFDYSSIDLPSCGTAACIGGWLCQMGIERGELKQPCIITDCLDVNGLMLTPVEAGACWVGLDPEGELADALFYGYDHEEAGLDCCDEMALTSVEEAQDRIDKVIAYLEKTDEA